MTVGLYYDVIDTPVGELTVIAADDAVIGVRFGRAELPGTVRRHTPVLTLAVRELSAYFEGQLFSFTVPVRFVDPKEIAATAIATGSPVSSSSPAMGWPSVTPFRKRVWQALMTVPYGKTATYAGIAKLTGNERAGRAVGSACHTNPISVIVPCHRIVGSDGSLRGFAGGLSVKEALISHEKTHLKTS